MKLCRCGCGTEVPMARTYAMDHSPASQARWADHSPHRGPCRSCEVEMITGWAWWRLTPEARQASDHVRLGARGLCHRCYQKSRYQPSPGRPPIIRREDMLSEWEILRSDGVTDLAIAAERIGTTRAALEKCLERARKAGDPRGQRYRNDQLGGLTPRRRAA